MIETIEYIETGYSGIESNIKLTFDSFHDIDIAFSKEGKLIEEDKEFHYLLDVLSIRIGAVYTKIAFESIDEACIFYEELVEWEGIFIKKDSPEHSEISDSTVHLFADEGIVVLRTDIFKALALEFEGIEV